MGGRCRREVPREVLLLVIRSFGGVAAWDGAGSPHAEADECITHQVYTPKHHSDSVANSQPICLSLLCRLMAVFAFLTGWCQGLACAATLHFIESSEVEVVHSPLLFCSLCVPVSSGSASCLTHTPHLPHHKSADEDATRLPLYFGLLEVSHFLH